MRLLALALTGAMLLSGTGCDAIAPAEKATQPSAAAGELPPIYPFDQFFAAESVTAPRVSPDGSMVAYIAPVNGVTNFFVAPVDDISSARQLSAFDGHGVRATDVSGNVMYRWSLDGRYIIFPKDYEGDENWDIWAINVETGEVHNLTPNPDRKTQIVQLSDADPAMIAVSDSAPGLPLPKLYSLNIITGAMELLADNDKGFLAFIADRSLKAAAGVSFDESGGLNVVSLKGDEPALLESVAPEDVPSFSATAYTGSFMVDESNEHLYRLDSEGRDTNALVRMDLTTGEKEEIAIDPRVDVSRVLYEPATGAPIGYAAIWERLKWTPLNPAYATDFEAIRNYLPAADYYIENISRDNRVWIVRYMESNRPSAYYAYNREGRTFKKLFVSTPQLEDMVLEPLHPYVMKSDDGLEYVSYYMLPAGSDPDGDGMPETPAPMVMLVHGGPSDERAIYAFGPFLHWLSNRGYGALYVNYRGSAGFGKAFMNAQNGEWGGKMHQDLIDQVDWAIAKGIADPEKIGLLGGSYGGYATLVGMTMTPDVFACGVEIVGPSNLSIPMPHWDPSEMEKRFGGDPRTEEGREFLLSRSPVTYAGQTKHPVLIGQGDQDSRVPTAQSDEVVEKMRAAGAKVTYIRFPDEGHGFVKRENVRAFWGVAEVFLGECLGGRAEPIGDKFKGSSLIVPAGAEYIPGMVEALEAREED